MTTRMSYSGSTSVNASDLVLMVQDLPPGPFHTGIFITSPDQAQTPLGDGNLCLGTQTLGFVVRLFPGIVSSAQGTASLPRDHTAPPLPLAGVDPGETWNYQAWYRDAVSGSATSNFTDGLSITFQ